MHRRMETTESHRKLSRAPACTPLLRLLFSGGSLVKDAPAIALRPGETSIGRDVHGAGDIRLETDRQLSREHAVLKIDGSAAPIRLYDRKSKNGTFVNGVRRDEAALRDGDVIRLGESILMLRHQPAELADASVDSLVGISVPINALRSRIALVAPRSITVLLLGESGTGKEVSAQALHKLSGRSGPFLAVNCSAIPESLAESQLFGHTAGSFTGASKAHKGYFVTADRGTLFLDEVADLPLRLQASLLRALEERAVIPVGAAEPVPSDIRLIAATNQDLRQAVAQGRFRGDLLARLAAVILELPPLRSRREDILLLLLHHLGQNARPMTAQLAEALVLYRWPFNVRELIQIAANLELCPDELLDLPLIFERLSFSVDPSATPRQLPAEHLADVRDKTPVPTSPPKQPLPREVLVRLMEEHHGLIARVAAAVGRSRRQVSRWLEQYQIDPLTFSR